MNRFVSFLISITIAFNVLFSCASFSYAYETRLSDDINPIYQNVELTKPETKLPYVLKSAASSNTVFTDYKSAAMFVRDCMVKREKCVVVKLSNSIKDNLQNVYRYSNMHHYYTLYGAFSFEIANSSSDGDYLAIAYTSASCSRVYGDGYVQYTYNITYRTTEEQEKAVDDYISSNVAELKAKNLSNLELIREVHEKICALTSYGEESDNTAYSAVAEGKTMCEGYSSLFYKFCRELNIPVRIVESNTHAWNIVKPTQCNLYYNIDVTWDDGYDFPDENNPNICDYYLKCDGEMQYNISHRGYLSHDNTDHNRLDYYNSDYFNSNFPISTQSFYLDKEGVAVCAYCGAEVDGAVPTQNEHSYVKTVINPSCIENGSYVYTCTHCGDVYKENIAPKGHKFSKYVKYCKNGCKTPNPNYTVRKTAFSKVTPKKKSIVLKWVKNDGVKGYQIQYSTTKSFTKKTTVTVTVKKAKTVSKTVKRLKRKKKYYVRIRCYDTLNNKRIYSKWSNPKSVKTK